MVIGLFPSPDLAGECLSNLEEADFAPRDLSIVTRTRAEADALAHISGRLHGVTPDELARRLQAAGLSAADAGRYRDAVVAGGVFVAVEAGDAADAAREMLQDARAREVRVLGTEKG